MNGRAGNQEAEVRARDEHAGDYEVSYRRSKGYFYDWVEKRTVLAALRPGKGDTALDVGCGTGRISRLLARKCARVYGLDFSPKSVEVLNASARELGLGNLSAEVWDITKPFPLPVKVDLAASVQVLQHVVTPGLRRTVLKNIYEQLRPGGTCVVCVYNWLQFRRQGGAKEGQFDNGIYYYRFTPDEAAALFRECGFREVSVTGCLHFRMVGRFQGRPWEPLLAPLAWLDVLLARSRLFRGHADFLVCRGIK